ncbi:MAG: aminotransferase class I/II-fold pyridoxal phosphate-dependent enzyme [bacterium]|jgi:cystathionine beta-lyase/cystathionine gamma-synthase|nr:aminotransferase class I/II-fold pyridoxal phosphate-dependent enzyme [bacterium]
MNIPRAQSTLFRSFDSLCCRAGTGSGDGQSLVAPIVQSTTFCRDGVDSRATHQYSRVSNPTVSALEEVLGALEAAPPAVCFATGLAAETALLLALLRQGDHVVCGRAVYGGTTRLLQRILAPLGIEAAFVDTTSPAAVAAAITPRTRLVFVETPANPTLEVTDIRAIASLAHGAGALLVVDNTFLTPALQQPLSLGADITVTSTTKFIDGHSVAPGGAVVSRDEALLEHVRFVRKSTGAIQTPQHAWLTLQGIKTLPLRLRAQSATAATLAHWLARHPAVARVHYPSLVAPELAAAQHLGADGAVLSFELSGGLAAARGVAGALRLCRLVEHVGSVETLVTHPASMTHADVSPADRARAGIADGLLRLSVGLEDVADIRDDLSAALSAQVPEVAR